MTMHNNLKPLKATGDDELKMMTEMIMRCHGLSTVSMKGISPSSIHKVDAIVKEVFVTGVSRYSSLEEQSADLAVLIATLKPFHDGNMETSVLSAVTIMDAYGRPVACDDDAMVTASVLATIGDRHGVMNALCSFPPVSDENE